MIKSITAATYEIDDPESAAAEIATALKLETELLKNSIGIVTCFSEFEDTGALKAICDALPFDCIGATTCISACAGEVGQAMLGITVLTSDDCDFKATAIMITENYGDAIRSGFNPLAGPAGEKPDLLLGYFPLINTISGDMLLNAIDEASGGAPLFGTTAVDHHTDYSTAKTIFNGEAYREAVVLCGVFGAAEIAFEIASIDESKVRNQKAIITGSEGSLLTGVNGKTALEYFEEIGLLEDEIASGLGIVPLMVDYRDGTKPVARAVFALTPDGSVVCGGAMPQQATLGIGSIDLEDVLRTTGGALKSLADKNGALLCYSCIGRYLALGANSSAEAKAFAGATGDLSYLFACSGGEICPLPDVSGKLKNFYHNYTAVMCRLK